LKKAEREEKAVEGGVGESACGSVGEKNKKGEGVEDSSDKREKPKTWKLRGGSKSGN